MSPVSLALLLAGIGYPFWVHAALARSASTWVIMLPMIVLWAAQWLCADPGRPGGRLLPPVALAGCLIFSVSGSERLVLWYPVLINAAMLAIFGGSLLSGSSVIERIARLRHPRLPADAIRYTRRVTKVWCVFFLCNGVTAAVLVMWAPRNWWVAYNGCISYVLIGLLVAGEWLIRPRVDGAP